MTSGDADLEVRLVAVPASASIVRERLREWLAARGWPEPALDDVVLAANEAVSNSIEHGYVGREPGDVLVTARVEEGPDGRAVRLVVRDNGSWRPERAAGYRGRGLPVMRGCTAELDVRGGAGGTVVEMLSTAVAPIDLAAGRDRRADPSPA
jgi:serine/threonine-protein kinase RsbW